MGLQQKGMHGTWASRWTFIMAATGSAVGLGNMWKFPYVAGNNGGGAFVLAYLACILLQIIEYCAKRVQIIEYCVKRVQIIEYYVQGVQIIEYFVKRKQIIE